MREAFDWHWIEERVAETIEVWHGCAARSARTGPRYSVEEQTRREQVYDEGLREVEREAKRRPRNRAERLEAQQRITASFARFSSTALDLPDDATQLLTDDFLPVGSKLARWARRFDESLSMADIIQANRNAWTACGLQPLLGERIGLTPSILGYSLLYPYTDNFLDRADVSGEAKRRFGERFRRRLEGERIAAEDSHEATLWALVELVEGQYPRADYAQVFACMLAIHRAQQGSVAQVGRDAAVADGEVLRISCAKGGSSVLADACLARGELSAAESRFGFEWGVLLQLGDDLQDVREDMQRGSVTLFSRAAAMGVPLDGLANQLLSFSDHVGARMDGLAHGSAMLKDLLRMSWRSLIVGAVADSHEFFSRDFVAEIEQSSAFRFEFLRARRKRLASREGLYAVLFDAFLEAPDDDDLETTFPVPVLAAV
ncbi:MAG: hypothetical protein M3O31_10980 [Acidobacteriota bacterium]|nr:hypothetical protein [Acidobacteriota bacterium]